MFSVITAGPFPGQGSGWLVLLAAVLFSLPSAPPLPHLFESLSLVGKQKRLLFQKKSLKTCGVPISLIYPPSTWNLARSSWDKPEPQHWGHLTERHSWPVMGWNLSKIWTYVVLMCGAVSYLVYFCQYCLIPGALGLSFLSPHFEQNAYDGA